VLLLVAVTVVTNDQHKVFCAMFHDTTDGASLSAFVAQELLAAFIVQHGDELGNMGHNLRDFHRFQYRILSVIRESVKPIVRKCACFWLRELGARSKNSF
jgi:hypothetical protein